MKKLLLLILALGWLTACNDSSQLDLLASEEALKTSPVLPYTENEMVKGMLRIKLKEAPTQDINITHPSDKIATGVQTLDQSIPLFHITRIERTFPYSEKYEQRTRKEGLHLWYNVWYDPNVAVTAACNHFNSSHEIEQVCPVHKIKTRYIRFPWNDPYLKQQWNFYNSGQEIWQQAQADIRLLPVWEQYNGHPSIIVAVIDEGVDILHPDLQANLWINPGEIANDGIDNDSNGYIDDVHGYNFIDQSPDIIPFKHGTHVAGIIGAVNHNGIGLCGIAGGNGTPNSGVKLMCCQMLSFGIESAGAEAIKYAADNGAIICQNSWGYTGEIDPVDKEAIDYFVKYAGCDNEGNQLPDSPMKGGVVIFATNNNNTAAPSDATPADYEKVIGVAAIRADYQKGTYSDYGDYIDICAPGGENERVTPSGIIEKEILSTVTNKDYDYMYGASMACPHVSGVAALIVEKYGLTQRGFTADQLKDILFNTAYNVDKYNPRYVGQLGFGCVNAEAALHGNSIHPEKPVSPSEQHSFLLYNNPITDGYLSFKVTSKLAGPATLTIYNSIGQRVFRKDINVIAYAMNKVLVNNLSTGYYTFQYQCKNYTHQEKIIVH